MEDVINIENLYEMGPEIRVDFNRPDWLLSDEPVQCQNKFERWCNTNRESWESNTHWAWENIPAIRLPKDHPYYKATELGYTYWSGIGQEPTQGKYDILFRDGLQLGNQDDFSWKHVFGDSDVIGYKEVKSPNIKSIIARGFITEEEVRNIITKVNEADTMIKILNEFYLIGELDPIEEEINSFRKFAALTVAEEQTLRSYINWKNSRA